MAQDKVVIDIVAKDKTKQGIKSSESSFKGLAKTLSPLIAVGFGVAAVKSATDAYIRQENAVAQLDARLKSTGNAVGIASKELQKMAASLQGVTTFGDEAIIEMQSLLLTFTQIGGETFPQATEAILNVSTAMGQDLKSSAIQVGKALNDPILGVTALARSGIQFTESQKDMIKELTTAGDLIGAQSIILKELETQFGGAARAAKDTLGGALISLSNTFGDEVFEALGKSGTGFIPLIQQLEEILKSPQFGEGMDSLASAFSDIGWALGQIGEASKSAAPFFEFLTDKGLLDNLPVFRELALIGTARQLVNAASADGRQPMPALPDGEIISPEEQARVNAKTTGSIVTEEIDQMVTDKELDQLTTRLANQEAIWEVQRQQLADQNAYKMELYDADVQASAEASKRKAEAEQNARDAGMQALSDLGSLMNSENKKAFEIGKAARISETVINTYSSATKAFGALAEIPVVGPALGAVAAAAAVAAGLANVQAISATKFGGKGSGTPSVPSFSSSGGVASVQPVGQPQNATPQTSFGDNIEVRTGSIIGVLLEEEIIPALIEAQTRGVQVVIT